MPAAIVLGLLATAAGAEPAAAPPTADCIDVPDCVVMVQSARRLSDANQLHAAHQTYAAAYARWQSPWLLINIGRIQQKLGRPTEAIVTYQHYLDISANDKPERIDSARGFLKQAEQDLATSRAVAAASRAAEKPLYKKRWFWLAIGAVAITAGAITTGAVLANPGPNSNGTPGPFHIQF